MSSHVLRRMTLEVEHGSFWSTQMAGRLSKRISPSRKGFTLVELLVVIGIIALLLSILLPSLNKAKEQANQTKCLNNLRQIGMALVMYADGNKGKFPWGARYDIPQKEDWIHFQAKPFAGAKPPGRDVADFSNSALAPYMAGAKQILNKDF